MAQLKKKRRIYLCLHTKKYTFSCFKLYVYVIPGILFTVQKKLLQNKADTKINLFSTIVAIIELNENEENQVTRDIVENWSIEEQAMEMDLNILQQVEDLERRVASASLQVKVKLT